MNKFGFWGPYCKSRIFVSNPVLLSSMIQVMIGVKDLYPILRFDSFLKTCWVWCTPFERGCLRIFLYSTTWTCFGTKIKCIRLLKWYPKNDEPTCTSIWRNDDRNVSESLHVHESSLIFVLWLVCKWGCFSCCRNREPITWFQWLRECFQGKNRSSTFRCEICRSCKNDEPSCTSLRQWR